MKIFTSIFNDLFDIFDKFDWTYFGSSLKNCCKPLMTLLLSQIHFEIQCVWRKCFNSEKMYPSERFISKPWHSLLSRNSYERVLDVCVCDSFSGCLFVCGVKKQFLSLWKSTGYQKQWMWYPFRSCIWHMTISYISLRHWLWFSKSSHSLKGTLCWHWLGCHLYKL